MTVATTATRSLATAQRSLGDPTIDYPLWPPLTEGCPRTSTPEIAYPLEIAYDYARCDPRLFDAPLVPGHDRWEPLLPPLAPTLDLGEGATPLVAAPRLAAWAGFDGPVYIKDEGRNPTWSHKDRLNRCTVSAAVLTGAPGIVAASSGNHGASAAAYAARAGLPCVVVTSTGAPAAVRSFLLAYGAAVIGVPTTSRWDVLRDIVDRLGYQPVSNRTVTHTGHPFGPEGYKTIAYELFLQLGRTVPAAVFMPTGYAELLFGVWKGFTELHDLGIAATMPTIVAAEPGVRAPLARALAAGLPATVVEPAPTAAYSAAVTISGYRGVVAIREGGWVATPGEATTAAAQTALAREGLWQEQSGALSLAALHDAVRLGRAPQGPVVCITTSSGFKDIATGSHAIPEIAPDWATVSSTLRQQYGVG